MKLASSNSIFKENTFNRRVCQSFSIKTFLLKKIILLLNNKQINNEKENDFE